MDKSQLSEGLEKRSDVKLGILMCQNPETVKEVNAVIGSIVGENIVAKYLNKDYNDHFVTKFREGFNKVLLDNVEINGVPLEMCQDQSFNTVKKEEKLAVINDNYLPKVGNLLVKVSNLRKSYPQQIVKLIEKRHEKEIQRLEKYEPSLNIEQQQMNKENLNNEEESWASIEDNFQNVVKGCNDYNKTLQTEIERVKRIQLNIQQAEKIYTQDSTRSFFSFV